MRSKSDYQHNEMFHSTVSDGIVQWNLGGYQFRMELVTSRPRRAIVAGVGAWVTFQSLSDGRGKRFKLKLAVE